MKILIEDSVQSIIRQRGICNLIHFTNLANLESILQNGLCSALKLRENDVVYECTDCNRKDGLIEYVSYSIEFPNYMYLKSLIQKNNNKYVVLRLNIDCLFGKAVHIHKSNPYLPRWGIAETFEDLFFEKYRYCLLPNNFPTDPRAEIQFNGVVNPKYINGIFYPSNLTISLIDSLREKYSDFRFVKDDYYFGDRMDSQHWANIRKLGLDVYR